MFKSSLTRVAKELKAFKKGFIKVGEVQIVTLEVQVSSFAYKRK